MRAGSPEARSKTRTPHAIRFRHDDEAGVLVADRIAEERGHLTKQQKAAFFGMNETTWGRLIRGEIEPGRETIAAVLGGHPDDPEITFDALFEVVSDAVR